MSASEEALAVTALARFGLGGRPGDIETVARDPRGQTMAELSAPVPTPTGLPNLTELFMQKFRWEEHLAETTRRKPKGMQLAGAMSGDAQNTDEALPPGVLRMPEGRAYDAEVDARIALLMGPVVGLPERLVWFWSNHFAVAAGKGGWQRGTVGVFERDVVRPHALGRFSDMLRASTQHFAMVNYLDNANSVGPNSARGRIRGGLNENLAREVLELHTLGVGGGYRQPDVESFAAILTGWTNGDPRNGVAGGSFVFDASAHEPGRKTLLGRSYAAGGVEEGLSALDDLARHPSTARFLAFKLARHFVADVPPPPLVARLASVFLDTGGDLRALACELVSADESWAAAPTKLRTPQEFLAASLRAMGVVPSARTVTLLLRGLGHRIWYVPGPDGYPDVAAAWLSPASFRARFEVASAVAERERSALNPLELARAVLGASLARDTADVITASSTRHEAMSVLLLSSEFQRR